MRPRRRPMAWIASALAIVATPTLAEAQQPGPARTVARAQNVAEEIACAPATLDAPPTPALRVSGGYEHGRLMFGPGESLLVDAGSRQGVQNGQVYYVRRYVRDMFTPAWPDFTPVSIHTAGWVTIVDTKADAAVAQVTHACDGILDGDYLEPYTEPEIPPASPDGQPDYAHPARIVLADERLQAGAAGTLMLINRGSDHGVRAGQSLTIYRETLAGAGPILDVGRGTILSVQPHTSLMRIDSSNDAVYIGDLTALHRRQ